MAQQTTQPQRMVQDPNEVTLKDLYLLSKSHWWWYVLSVALCLAAATFYLLRTPKVYTRQASVLVKEASSSSSSLMNQLDGAAELGMFKEASNVNNEVLTIKMPAVILEVIQRLHLDYNYMVDGTFHKNVIYGSTLPIQANVDGLSDNSNLSFKLNLNKDGKYQISKFKFTNQPEGSATEFSGAVGDSIATPAGKLCISKSPYYDVLTEDMEIFVTRTGLYAMQTAVRANLNANISSKQATIIDLTYSDTNTQRAEEILNTVIAVSKENWVKDKNQVAVSTSEFISERLAVIEDELGNVDASISDYKSANLITNDAAATSMYMNQAAQASNNITQLNNQLYMVRYLRQNLQNGDNSSLLPENSGLANNAIEQQFKEYNTLVLQRNNLVANSSEKNPLVQDLDKKIGGIKGNIMSGLNNEQAMLNEQVRGQQATVGANTSKLASNPNQQKYLLSQERQQSVKQSLYLFLLQKREENELSQAFTAYNTRVVNPPMGSVNPTSPKSMQILAIAFLLGLAIPLAIIYLKECVNTRVRGRKDLEKLTAPYLGEVPQYYSKKSGKVMGMKVVVKPMSRSIINEAFRVIRTNFAFMAEDKENPRKTVLLTSCNPGSGKSFLSINLAAALALTGKKVCVIDLDLRMATSSKVINQPEKGIAGYLAGLYEECPSYPVEGTSGMTFIPVGTIPPNPAELLLSPRLEALIKKLRDQYDYVFIDTPPVELVADTSIIKKWVDMTIFVVRAELLERDMLPVIQEYYDSKKFNNMAILLNGTTTAHGRYGYHYGYHSYGYGGTYGGYGSDK
ncbi:MAG: polysaccharide biosynthesis tyrosine autokinase [Bacteroidaceae bacterium]|nr:polysaccharide biosynthesis tyrosine autokinase [Bacteroidaceae bacterium]